MSDEITWALQHPDMSEALLVDASPVRTERGLKAQMAMYVLQNFDVMLDVDEWHAKVVPDDTPTGYSLFD